MIEAKKIREKKEGEEEKERERGGRSKKTQVDLNCSFIEQRDQYIEYNGEMQSLHIYTYIYLFSFSQSYNRSKNQIKV